MKNEKVFGNCEKMCHVNLKGNSDALIPIITFGAKDQLKINLKYFLISYLLLKLTVKQQNDEETVVLSNQNHHSTLQ